MNRMKSIGKNSRRSDFSDDCGAWSDTKGSSPKTWYLILENDLLKKVFWKNGKYCTELQENKQRRYLPLEPQPKENQLLGIQRYYATLKSCPFYKKRVTRINHISTPSYLKWTHCVIVEYLGKFPGTQLHGNAKTLDVPYTRTSGRTMDKIEESLSKMKPRVAYNKLLNEETIDKCPKNLQQLYSKNYHVRNKERKINASVKNLADQVQHITKIMESQPIIRSVVFTKDNIGITLYSDDQILDFSRFCCLGLVPLIFDKTYNLGKLYVTPSTFKNLAVTYRNSNDHPITRSTFEAYNHFFSSLSSTLRKVDTSKLVLGTDDETSLRQVIKFNFPAASNILCSRHLFINTVDYLRNKVGLNKADRHDMVDRLFGSCGLTDSQDPEIFDERCEEILGIANQFPKFQEYLNKRLIPTIREGILNVRMKHRNLQRNWTNNNAESMNHVLKQLTDWKPKPVHELVDTLIGHIKGQYKDVERAMIGKGPFTLDKKFNNIRIKPEVYSSKTSLARRRTFLRFLQSHGKDTTSSITSTDGLLSVPRTPQSGKKPHQTKRKRTERTVKVKKQKVF